MRTLEIAIGLIEQDDEYILQLRENKARIGAAGLIGCFGGQIDDEKDESTADAVARELAEETNLVTKPEDWRYLGPVKVVSDRDSETVNIEADVFLHELKPGQVVVATDGQVARIKKNEAHKRIHEFTSATKAVFEELVRS